MQDPNLSNKMPWTCQRITTLGPRGCWKWQTLGFGFANFGECKRGKRIPVSPNRTKEQLSTRPCVEEMLVALVSLALRKYLTIHHRLPPNHPPPPSPPSPPSSPPPNHPPLESLDPPLSPYQLSPPPRPLSGEDPGGGGEASPPGAAPPSSFLWTTSICLGPRIPSIMRDATEVPTPHARPSINAPRNPPPMPPTAGAPASGGGCTCWRFRCTQRSGLVCLLVPPIVLTWCVLNLLPWIRTGLWGTHRCGLIGLFVPPIRLARGVVRHLLPIINCRCRHIAGSCWFSPYPASEPPCSYTQHRSRSQGTKLAYRILKDRLEPGPDALWLLI